MLDYIQWSIKQGCKIIKVGYLIVVR